MARDPYSGEAPAGGAGGAQASGYFVGPDGPEVTGELDPEVKESIDTARAAALKLLGALPDGGPSPQSSVDRPTPRP